MLSLRPLDHEGPGFGGRDPWGEAEERDGNGGLSRAGVADSPSLLAELLKRLVYLSLNTTA